MKLEEGYFKLVDVKNNVDPVTYIQVAGENAGILGELIPRDNDRGYAIEEISQREFTEGMLEIRARLQIHHTNKLLNQKLQQKT